MMIKRIACLLCGLALALAPGMSPVRAETVAPSNPDDAVALTLLSALGNRVPIIVETLAEPALLRDLAGDFGGPGIAFTHLALLDLDRDGQRELALRFPLSEYEPCYWILDVQNGAVYGYEVVSRGMLDLKADGSFTYSSGAMDNGVGLMALNRGVRDILPLTWVEPKGDGAAWFVDGKPASEQAFFDASQSQGRKEDARWLPYPEELLGVLFP